MPNFYNKIELDRKNEELYNEILKSLVGESITTKGDLIRIFQDYSEGKSEFDNIILLSNLFSLYKLCMSKSITLQKYEIFYECGEEN